MKSNGVKGLTMELESKCLECGDALPL